MNRLEEIRERASKATPGPWGYRQAVGGQIPCHGSKAHFSKARICGGPECVRVGVVDSGEMADLEFIAHSREDIPWLWGEVERIGKENAKLKDELEHCADGAMVLAAESAKLDEKVARLTAERDAALRRAEAAEAALRLASIKIDQVTATEPKTHSSSGFGGDYWDAPGCKLHGP